MESIALELSILWFIFPDGHMDCDLTIHNDNTGVVGDFYIGCTCNIPHNESLCCMAPYTILSNITISPVYISSTSNRADLVNRSAFVCTRVAGIVVGVNMGQ